MAETKYQHVLGWSSPFDLVCKLENECHRMEEAETLRDLVDHTMNFALTAYHMSEWVWEVVQRRLADDGDELERADWIAAIGFEPKSPQDVRDWALSACPELEYCRQLANATKHLSCRGRKGAPAAEFSVARRSKSDDEKRSFASLLDDHLSKNWRLVIVDVAGETDLVEVLQTKVWPFWSNLTWSIYIGDEA